MTAHPHRRYFLGAAAMTVAAASFDWLPGTGGAADPLAAIGAAPTWINSGRRARDTLRGRVVAVQFGTFTCINWLRTLPYVRAWQRKYADLLFIGVHTPEFTFEQRLEDVRRALQGLGIDYPVVVDNDYAIWRAFANQYWPALYLLDGGGRVEYHRFGEGEYERTERRMYRMLAEAGMRPGSEELVTVAPSGIELQADWSNLRTGEVYVGYGRARGFSSPGGLQRNQRVTYAAPPRLPDNAWALTGEWTVGREAAAVDGSGARLICRFHARDVHLVMTPAAHGASVPFRVTLDGEHPGPARGLDLDERGNGLISESRLYQLIRQPGPIASRAVTIEFLDAGAHVFAFTFG